MRASELNLKQVSFNFSANIFPSGSHCRMLIRLGRVFPTTKSQAKYFLAKSPHMDVLNSKDVELIDAILNKHGFTGKYHYTKSKNWVRLENHGDLQDAIKAEYK